MFTIWDVAIMLRTCLFNFINGIKDGIVGVFLVYHLDRRLQRMHEDNEDKQKWYQETIAARERLSSYRRTRKNTEIGCKKNQKRRLLSKLFIYICFSVFMLASLCFFSAFLLPTLHYYSFLLLQLKYENPSDFENVLYLVGFMLDFFIRFAWVIPLYIICKIVNGFWFADIAEDVFVLYYGKTRSFQTLGMVTADFIYSIFLETVFLLQASVMKFLFASSLGWLIYGVHQSLLLALYAFEYKWFYMGINLRKRIQIIEEHWPYFAGFGLPYFLATQLVYTNYSGIASGYIFAIAFQFMLICAMRASVPRIQIGHKVPIFQPSVWVCSCLCTSFLKSKQSRR